VTTGPYALSLKQPWAALVAHGRKTIEVRAWPTRLRGRVLIHAARVPDERPDAWARVPPELQEATTLRGGILGSAELTGCRVYSTLDAFLADQPRHLNEPGWFRPPRLYGFLFTDATPLPFLPCQGQTRFFRVPTPPSEGFRPRLLVSVREVAEVEAALAGGGALIDVKEPARGPLGRADDATIAAVVRAVAGRVPVSAALGEWRDRGAPEWPGDIEGLTYLKWGLSGCGAPHPWRGLLAARAHSLAVRRPGAAVVAVAYADWRPAQAPPPEEVCAWACEQGRGAFLLDTWGKDGSTLLDHVSAAEVEEWCVRCRAAGVRVAIGGSLGPEQIRTLLPARPDWFAVRGAACAAGKRTAPVAANRVRRLCALLAPEGAAAQTRRL
jgi:uncharacterized protein (UPF0264 family)